MQNIVLLAGNVGTNPETRATQSDTSITTFTLATSRTKYVNGKVQRDAQGRRVQETEWHRITCFNGLGKIMMEHCKKGMKVSVQGRIHYSKWTDKDGIERYGCEIIADAVNFLSYPRESESGTGTNTGNGYGDGFEDEIPF